MVLTIKHFLLAILQNALVVFPLLVQSLDQSGFISIDCGLLDVPSYTDETTGITYVSDANFTESGESKGVSPTYKGETYPQEFWNVRSFPDGDRNCYTLTPSQGKGMRYLIRARFMYGNYDNKNQTRTFNLSLGVDHWDTIKIEDARTTITAEIIHVPPSDHMYVCLVNTGNGTPFISVLELRQLGIEFYTSKSGTSLKLHDHYDFSSQNTDVYMRYKDDVYDRLWSPLSSDKWKPFIDISSSDGISIKKNDFQLPLAIMTTAYTGESGTSDLHILWETLDSSSKYFFYMHFAELEVLQSNQSREFNIYINNKLWYKEVAPEYLITETIYSSSGYFPNEEGTIDILLNNTNTATLPPLINAMELYVLKELSGLDTNQIDVEAMWGVKSAFGIKRISWQGDPCGPEVYLWDGLKCVYTADNQSRIVSLNLSSSGLKGEIASSIANLTMLENLDLSNNNLTGMVPEFLAQLSFLKILNLNGNNFTGPIPDALSERSKNGLLLLISLDTNSSVTTISCSSGSCGKKKNFVVPLVASLSGLLLVVIVTVAVIWSFKRRKQEATDLIVDSTDNEDRSLVSKKQQFTYSEIGRITNNFERVLGEGGFGKVYHGYLNGIEVAVKMLSPSSIQGHRQFHAELRLLLRVHHKNLTSLIGYCNESTNNNIGLIYEYMAMGNLRSHLSGNSPKILSWENRLRIAVDTAQGLEYLHNGCKPPIVHRDVKSTNILLNEKFQAKLSDFGLSKIFPGEGEKHISSTRGISVSVAGTPGYLDPEYYVSNWLSEKSDVYSFGVVLLEIITARPVLAKTRETNHISEWVSSMLANGDIDGIVDPRLKGLYDKNTVWKATEIAMACVSNTSTNRPTMSTVVTELKVCLTTESARKDGRDEDESKVLAEMMSPIMTPEPLIPLAR